MLHLICQSSPDKDYGAVIQIVILSLLQISAYADKDVKEMQMHHQASLPEAKQPVLFQNNNQSRTVQSPTRTSGPCRHRSIAANQVEN